MTKDQFKALTDSGIVLLDGGTGSVLRSKGMPVGVSTELWISEHPAIVTDLQRAYVDAGSRIVLAPTFSANRISLAMHDIADRLEEINRKNVAITRAAVDGRAYVAADLATTGKRLDAEDGLSYDEMLDVYREQVKILVDEGVDLFMAETMLSVDETAVVLDAVQSVCDLPVMCSLTLQADGSALFGGSGVEAVETLQEMGAAAVGLNCSVGPDQLESVIAAMKGVAKVHILAKPNAGMPTLDTLASAHNSMDAQTFAGHMKTLVNAGATIIGGCCGTTPEYIRALRDKVM
ncbi:MAG: homocysteine S-methyltransferase family protein [Clostridia bacterium]|nr:homocysteine S-methyltransferase family protein [Clostridia bacterium]